MQKAHKKIKVRKPQHQNRQPGLESKMSPKPQFDKFNYTGSGKLKDKIAVITGGDSGIGRAIAIAFAKEGANISIIYLNEHSDAKETKKLVEEYSRECIIIPGDAGNESFCKKAIDKTYKNFKRLDILINNAAMQFPQDSIEKITSEQLLRTFKSNIFSCFYMVKAALKYLKEGGVIINTTS